MKKSSSSIQLQNNVKDDDVPIKAGGKKQVGKSSQVSNIIYTCKTQVLWPFFRNEKLRMKRRFLLNGSGEGVATQIRRCLVNVRTRNRRSHHQNGFAWRRGNPKNRNHLHLINFKSEEDKRPGSRSTPQGTQRLALQEYLSCGVSALFLDSRNWLIWFLLW
jgi:hypothetical protein